MDPNQASIQEDRQRSWARKAEDPALCKVLRGLQSGRRSSNESLLHNSWTLDDQVVDWRGWAQGRWARVAEGRQRVRTCPVNASCRCHNSTDHHSSSDNSSSIRYSRSSDSTNLIITSAFLSFPINSINCTSGDIITANSSACKEWWHNHRLSQLRTCV